MMTKQTHKLIVEALERCILMDTRFASAYRDDAEKCRKSTHTRVISRATTLTQRAEELDETAKAYKAALEEVELIRCAHKDE